MQPVSIAKLSVYVVHTAYLRNLRLHTGIQARICRGNVSSAESGVVECCDENTAPHRSPVWATAESASELSALLTRRWSRLQPRCTCWCHSCALGKFASAINRAREKLARASKSDAISAVRLNLKREQRSWDVASVDPTLAGGRWVRGTTPQRVAVFPCSKQQQRQAERCYCTDACE